MSNANPYSIPHEPGRWRAIILATLVHLALVIFLWVGVRWQNETPAAVEAEVWSPQTQVAAPRPEPVPEQPVPAPVEKAPPAPTRQPPAEPPRVERPEPKPDIALEQEKKRKALEEKQRREQLALEQEKKRKAAEDKKRQEQLALEEEKKRKAREEQEKLRKAEEKKREQERLAKQQAEEKRRAQQQAEADRKLAEEKKRMEAEEARQREALFNEEMRRITSGVAGTGGSGSAERSEGSRADASYVQQIAAKIKSNINFHVPENLAGNPAVEFEVRLLPDGSVAGLTKRRSSGVPGFDEAVARAIQSAQPFPKDRSGRVPSSFIGSHRPKDQ